MEPVTHFMTGACLARAGFNRKAAYATLAMTLAAETPDLDVLWSIRGPVANFQHHRGITHTFLALPVEALVVVVFVWLVHKWRERRLSREQSSMPDRAGATPPSLTAAPLRWGLLYGFVLIALLSHILLDWTNNYGVRPLFPFHPHWYAGSFVFIFEPVMFLALLLGLLAPALFGLVSSEIGARRSTFRGRGWAAFALIAVVALWALRWVQHGNAVELASNAGYGQAGSASPRVLRVTANPYPMNPFRWQTVVDTPGFYQIARVDTLHSTVDTDPGRDLIAKPEQSAAVKAADGSWLKRGWGAISAALVVLLSKAKLLLLGLTKAKTLLSMLAFVGVYFRLYGWPLAAGFVVSIYIHEMGHVAALARYGIRAGAPMFIPGLGAFVRLKQAPLNAREDARIGLAGPEWGLAAAAIAFAVFLVTRVPVWGAIAGLGAYLNLFNLLPFWQLDGARGFRALSRQQRWMAAGATAVAGLLATQPLLYVVAAVGAFRAWRSPEEAADRRAFVTYVALVALLTAIVAATASVAHR